jgi:predicted RNA polymerase sigma factor
MVARSRASDDAGPYRLQAEIAGCHATARVVGGARLDADRDAVPGARPRDPSPVVA